MIYLRWRDSDEAELSGAIHSGKRVFLTGDGYEDLPKEFSIQRRFGALLRQYREKRGMPITAPAAQPQLVRPGQESGEATAGPWKLRAPGKRLKWRLFFEDGSGNNSEEIDVSRLGELRSLALGLLGAKVKIDFRFTAAVDPTVRLTLLTPWDENRGDFHSYLEELASDIREPEEDRAETLASLSAYLSEYLPTEQPPDWRFEVDRTAFELDAGESAQFSIEVEAPTPGAVAFAIQMEAEVEGERLMVASDPLVVRVPADGSQQAELLGDDNLSGGGSELDQPNLEEEPAVAGAVVAY